MSGTSGHEAMEVKVDSGTGKMNSSSSSIDNGIEPNSATDKFLNKFAKLIPYIFGLMFLLVVVLWILGFVENSNIVWGIFLINIFISLFGAWAVYQYGVIQEQINRLKKQNEEFKNQITQLKETKNKLKSFVEELNLAVKNLQTDAETLNEQTKQFEPLIEELKKVAGDNEEINDIINKTNNIFSDMRKTVLENERAHLLSTFYECAFRDEDNKMDKKEYRRFLARLTKEQRSKFENMGDFDTLAGNDGQIDLQEFQEIIEKVLKDLDKLLRDKLSQN